MFILSVVHVCVFKNLIYIFTYIMFINEILIMNNEWIKTKIWINARTTFIDLCLLTNHGQRLHVKPNKCAYCSSICMCTDKFFLSQNIIHEYPKYMNTLYAVNFFIQVHVAQDEIFHLS